MPRTMLYQPLIDFLAMQTVQDVTLSFVAIEAIIGAPLSTSATIMSNPWHAMTHSYVRQWREMGWRATFDRRNRCVHFTRTEGG